MAERSAQIQLMRQVYHLAAFVRIWLGIGKREAFRCMQFIAYISGYKQAQISRYLAREEKANPDAPASHTAASVPKKILLNPVALLLIAAGLLLGLAGRTLITLGRPTFLAGTYSTMPLRILRRHSRPFRMRATRKPSMILSPGDQRRTP